MTQRLPTQPKEIVQVIALAILYALAGRAGLQLDAVSGFATLVWPPTGIALAALVVGGVRMWPAAFIGALITNLWTGAPLFVALGIACGNTLEAVIGAYLLRRIPGFRPSLDRVRDALGVIVFAAMLAPIVSASVGVASLLAGGLIASGHAAETWRAWWMGDAIGAVLVGPVLMVWAIDPHVHLHRRHVGEVVGLGLTVVVVSLLIFIIPSTFDHALLSQAYLFFPLLMWSAVRFGERGAASATFLISVFAVWGTALGRGPFVQPTLAASLLGLQAFMGVTASTFLILGASIAERRRTVRELRDARDVAASANRAKAEFLAVMSHELRTPLNAIAGYAEMMELGLAGSINDKQRDAITRIKRNQDHLLVLISQILDFAKIEAGRSEMAPRVLLVQSAFDAVEPLVQPQLIAQQITLERDGNGEMLELVADPAKLGQILLNLLTNAIKFTPAGGRIYLSATQHDQRVIMSVRDTGIGIPAEKLAQVFEPFYQVDSGTTRRYGGVGLGLTISRDMARAMDGDLSIASVVGQGCTVSVTLPAAALSS